MSRWYIGVALLAFSAVMLWGILTTEAPQEISAAELAGRVLRSQPDWADYQEDLKGQLGATPVARWKGRPLRARVDGAEVSIVFEVSGVWAEYDFALPVLIKDHLGKSYRNRSARRANSEVEYLFQLTGHTEGTRLPWVEVAYPHHLERLAFSQEGAWAAAVK